MEQYAVDGRSRSEVYITLALVSVACSYLAHSGVERLPFAVPWWLEMPTFAVWFGLINLVFDRWLWRIKILGVRFTPIPDFSGHWDGEIHTDRSRGEHLTIPVHVRIRQTWSSMDIRGETEQGVTRSKLIGVRSDDEEMRYEYETQAVVMSKNGKHHVGFGVLQFRDHDTLDGYYYTLGGTTRKGTMELHRALAKR